jgi:hypothetical protein
MVVARERFSLLSERRVYVLARKQDTQRFNELLKLLDTRIASITALTDKLAQLITVRS